MLKLLLKVIIHKFNYTWKVAMGPKVDILNMTVLSSVKR